MGWMVVLVVDLLNAKIQSHPLRFTYSNVCLVKWQLYHIGLA